MMTLSRAISLFGKHVCRLAVRTGVLGLAVLFILFAATIDSAHAQTGSTRPGVACVPYPDMPQFAPIRCTNRHVHGCRRFRQGSSRRSCKGVSNPEAW